MSQDELLALATRIAREAGELLLDHYQHSATGIETKTTPTDPVSDADRASETFILGEIRSARPDDGVISEESERRRPSHSGYTWIVDPLDGTVNFLYKIPVWCVSIAIHDEHGPLIGVVHDPNQDEQFSALRGVGATLNGEPITVSSQTDLSKALVGTGFSYDAKSRAVQADRIPRVLPRVRDIRRAGSAAIDLAWLACGRLDGFFEAPMKLWDRAGGEVLIQEAGGSISSLSPPIGDDVGLIAANPGLHKELRALVLGD
jgi:myo-inositol-1(or 4)-monophosphatase